MDHQQQYGDVASTYCTAFVSVVLMLRCFFIVIATTGPSSELPKKNILNRWINNTRTMSKNNISRLEFRHWYSLESQKERCSYWFQFQCEQRPKFASSNRSQRCHSQAAVACWLYVTGKDHVNLAKLSWIPNRSGIWARCKTRPRQMGALAATSYRPNSGER